MMAVNHGLHFLTDIKFVINIEYNAGYFCHKILVCPNITIISYKI